MQRFVFYFTYSFVCGVGIAFALQPSIDVVMPLYGFAAVAGIAGWGVAMFREKMARNIPEWLILVVLTVSAFAFGFARTAERIYIPPFDESAERNHAKSILDQFPDLDRNQTTRMIARISAETEYRPSPDRPGRVDIIIEPFEIEPEPGSGKKYAVSEGNFALELRPSRHFNSKSPGDQQYKALFDRLSRSDAYGLILEINAQVEKFRPALTPGLYDAEVQYNDQDVYGVTKIYFWPSREGEADPVRIINDESGEPLRDARYLVQVALAIKEKIIAVTKLTIPFPESAFLAGVTVGARRGLDFVKTKFEPAPAEGEIDFRQNVLDQFRWSGTSHVLAVSGLHVSIIAGSLWGIFVLLRVPKKIYAPLIVLALTIFCLITGARPSTIRAVIMNSLVVLTFVYLGSGFRASLLLAIGVSGFAILLDNPRWITKPAFALSFMAVLSLGLISRPLESCCQIIIPRIKKLPVWLQQFIYAQGAIQFGMMWPLSAYYFTQASVAGPLANFFAIPLIGVIVQLGIFAGLVGLVPVVGLYIALVLNAANFVMCWIFLWTAHLSTIYFPFPYVQTMTPRMLAGYYFLLAIFVWHQPLLRHGRILYYDLVMKIGGSRRRNQALLVFALAFAVISSVTLWSFWPREPAGKLRVTFLAHTWGPPVLYGGSVHVETPGGAQIVIDGGPNLYKFGWNTGTGIVVKYLLKDRIGSLDALVLTTTSPEELGGIADILNVIPVARFYSPVPVWDWDPDDAASFQKQVATAVGAENAENPANSDFAEVLFHFDQLAWELRAPNDINRIFRYLLVSPTSFLRDIRPKNYLIEAGTVLWREPNAPGGVFEIVALHPDPKNRSKLANDNSVVIKIRYGKRSFLLTGDLTEEGLAKLRAVDPELLRSDLLVVPCHGATPTLDEEFVKTVLSGKDHRYAVMTYGLNGDLKPEGFGRLPAGSARDSFLGHRRLYQKDAEAVAATTELALQKLGATVARIDKTGAVICVTDGKDLTVESILENLRPTASEGGGDFTIHQEF